MKLLTPTQVIAIVGLSAINKVGAQNCEPTCRVGYIGDGPDGLTEWSATIATLTLDGTPARLTAYYYTSPAETEAASEDGADVDWEIAGYTIS